MLTKRTMLEGEVRAEAWPLKEPFVISRGRRTHAEVVHVQVSDGHFVGHGECQPNQRYGETQEDVCAQLSRCFPSTIEDLQKATAALKSHAARNALDCALWDLRCKIAGVPAAGMLNMSSPRLVPTYFTLSVAEPEVMAVAAGFVRQKGCRRLKLKLTGQGDAERLFAVRESVPDASLIVDANEAWDERMLAQYLPILENVKVDLLEQPLPAEKDDALRELKTPITICADESCRVASNVDALLGKYDAVNIKLDKAGGLTPAIELYQVARNNDLKVMVGCMLGTSLAIAPALLVAAQADFVDLDAPLLLSQDRSPGFLVDGGFNFLGELPALWG